MNHLIRIARALPVAACVALAAATCQRSSGAASAPPAAPAQPGEAQAPADGGGIAGAWVHREMPVRYLESMTLRQQGDAVTGEGTYMMEGGRGGNTTITGTYRGGSLHLDLTRDSGVKETYVGRLENGRLNGTLTIDGNQQTFGFERAAQP